MSNRRNGWWQLWTILAVVWTLVVIMSGWMNLPRARHMPHDPRLLSKLSIEASSILHGTVADARPARGGIVWTDSRRIVRMLNGAALTFPATTTSERAEFVASEYRQLLTVEARTQTWPYLLEILAIWLAPLVVAGLAVSLIGRGYKRAVSRAILEDHSPSSAGRVVASAYPPGGTGNRTDDDATAYGVKRADASVRLSF